MMRRPVIKCCQLQFAALAASRKWDVRQNYVNNGHLPAHSRGQCLCLSLKALWIRNGLNMCAN